MSKMLFELNAPLVMGRVKEDFSVNNLWKYLRYYRMYLERFAIRCNGIDYTHRIEKTLFWRGVVALCKDEVFGLVVAEVDESKNEYDPNGQLVRVSVSAENGWKKPNLEVGKDVVLLYADETRIAPVLYVWAIANEIIDREDIIKTQDNMLRKPIIVKGVGEDFDKAIVQVSNVLSGVAYFNDKKKNGRDNIMEDKPLEVLNLQVGNAYKGAEVWDSRKHFEELLCDYLGYRTVKNEKKERMNTDEVNKDNSIGQTFYDSAVRLHKQSVEDSKKVLGLELEFKEVLKKQEGGEENVSDEKDVDSNPRK